MLGSGRHEIGAELAEEQDLHAVPLVYFGFSVAA
jgi:hypothetical protein